MKIYTEAYGLKMEQDTITQAFTKDAWGVRFSMTSDDLTSRHEFVLTQEEVEQLQILMQAALDSIKKVREKRSKFVSADKPPAFY